MRFRHDQIIEDGKVLFQNPLEEIVVVAGKVHERDEGNYVAWPNLLLYGTANCCQGSLGTVLLRNGKILSLNSLDLNVFDLQPVVIRGGRTCSDLGIIAAGYGCNGEGARLINTNRNRVYDLFPSTEIGKAEFRLEEGFQIVPYPKEGRFLLRNPSESYRCSGAEVNGSILTYNSLDMPERMRSGGDRELDLTSKLEECGVDIEASLNLAKDFVKTRRFLHLERDTKEN